MDFRTTFLLLACLIALAVALPPAPDSKEAKIANLKAAIKKLPVAPNANIRTRRQFFGGSGSNAFASANAGAYGGGSPFGIYPGGLGYGGGSSFSSASAQAGAGSFGVGK